MNIIADIAGQYDALTRLVAMMPKDEILLLGDLVDRGPHSMEVIQWAMDNQWADNPVTVLLGNHEHMMLDYYENTDIYDQFIWARNGGAMTMGQYQKNADTLQKHFSWLKKRKLFYKGDGLLVTHAAWSGTKSFTQACNIKGFDNLVDSILWSRYEPQQRDAFQVFGHNSQWGLKWFGDRDNPWAVCLDDSRRGVLTGMNWPSKEIFQAPYIASALIADDLGGGA